jgi:hypothetical protein
VHAQKSPQARCRRLGGVADWQEEQKPSRDKIAICDAKTDATYVEAEKYFSARALTDILYVVGSYMFLSRLIRTGGIPLDQKPAEVPPCFFK